MSARNPAGNRACFHCGLPVLELHRHGAELLGAAREFCCAGCEAVARTIVAAGFGSYYQTREPPRGRLGAAPLPQDLSPVSVYDEPAAQRQFVTSPREHEHEVLLSLDRLSCAACVWLNERTLRAIPGVVRADVNATTHRALVAWDERKVRLGQIIEAVRAIGYDAYPFDPQRQSQLETVARRAALWRLFVSGFAAMQVMMYAVPAYLDDGATLSPDAAALMRWAGLALTLPVLLFACGPFFGPAWRELRRGRIGLDAPIALGILAGFGASAWATLAGSGEVYFDSIAMLVFLLLAARSAEAAARGRAARSLDPLLRWMPSFALRMHTASFSAQTEKIAAHELLPGDLALVPPGERVPADGSVVHGASSADESLLTGESLPVPKGPGAELIAGSVNLEQPLVLRVERSGGETRAAAILRMVERAAASRPALVAGADRIARVLMWLVIATAVGAFAAWLQIAPERALWVAVAVLVVTCPCALALAAPIALSACTSQLLARGIVLTRARAIEALARASDVVLDKTGTLTQGRLRIVRTVALGALPQADCLHLAGTLETASRHPLAAAFERVASDAAAIEVANAIHRPGSGIEALVDGRQVRIGTEAFCRELARSPLPATGSDADQTIVCLADESGWLAVFDLEDEPREQAGAFVAALQGANLRVHLVSGDRRGAVAAAASRFGIADFTGDAQPQHKLEYVERLQRAGRVVVMIGDGMNDAPVLARADASIAMGSGAEVAQLNSDVVLLGSRLDAALATFPLARRTMRVIRQNFGWAIGYNALALPAAALGWIGPWEAAIGMAASSLIVALNSLRLVGAQVLETGPWKASSFSFRSPSRSYS
jgi:P-type Cu2+ transporter